MNHQNADFTQGSILKKLFWFMVPILGALILQAAYGAVDLLVVGRFGSTSGLSAVSTGSQVLNLVTFVVTQLAMGITVLIARYLGEKRPEQIAPLLGGGALVFALISVGLCILLVCFARPISILMQAPKESLDLTVSYIRICGSGIFFIVAYNLLSAIFRGLGDSKSPLLFVLVACVVNIFGDLFLVAGLHMDAAGAALATVFAQTISVICAVVILLKKGLPFSLKRSDFRFNPQCRKFLAIGLPLALQEFLTQLSFLALCAFVNRLGLEASSGYGVASKIVNFAMLVPSALMQSMASFVSQNIGAGNPKRAKQSMFTGIGVGLGFGCVVFALVMLKGDVLAGFFSTDAAVIQCGFDYLKGFAPETIVTAVLFSMVGYFNGNQKTVWVMVQGLVQTLLVRLPLAYVMSIQPNASLTNIGLAAPASTAVGILLNVGFYIYLNRKQAREMQRLA
ncbi:MAG: MATE family efflux transporter [Flintibacter sp.]|uniref:MATE family efflux transporter n=1 Tax=Flintibacter TaxID=1918454 RepID=UPI002673E355|nr:MATE family efflux transporter [Flintibacter sp.]MCI6150432.1 MATE family efflux transporter [Flintibacter sp.]MCI7660013.1 MATE family efflux transporter [Flintibacter sp.]MDD7116031.1 MATE family efflux transporter [Flintibacter sp.]MDY5039033.1 MATE family efflux transporter [Lawsonibacter sp.]